MIIIHHLNYYCCLSFLMHASYPHSLIGSSLALHLIIVIHRTSSQPSNLPILDSLYWTFFQLDRLVSTDHYSLTDFIASIHWTSSWSFDIPMHWYIMPCHLLAALMWFHHHITTTSFPCHDHVIATSWPHHCHVITMSLCSSSC